MHYHNRLQLYRLSNRLPNYISTLIATLFICYVLTLQLNEDDVLINDTKCYVYDMQSYGYLHNDFLYVVNRFELNELTLSYHLLSTIISFIFIVYMTTFYVIRDLLYFFFIQSTYQLNVELITSRTKVLHRYTVVYFE